MSLTCVEKVIVNRVRADIARTCCEALTKDELNEIVEYTIQKIYKYPKEYGKTVQNYFALLLPDEVKSYVIAREVNTIFEEVLCKFDIACVEATYLGASS